MTITRFKDVGITEAGKSSGRFAATSHDEQTAPLEGAHRLTRYTAAERKKYSDAYESAKRIGNRQGYRKGLSPQDSEDAIQDGMLSLLIGDKSKNFDAFPEPLISKVTSTTVSWRVDGARRHEDSRGLVKLKTQMAQYRQVHGTDPTGRAIDEMATDIRDNWPDPKHRPSVGFQRYLQRDDSIEALAEGGFTPSVTVDLYDDAVVAADAVSNAVLDGEVKAADAKSKAWDLLAGLRGAPEANPDQLTKEQARLCRAAVLGREGGVIAACTEFEDGKQTQAVAALFAPFGGSTPEGREAIVDMLTTLPGRANDVWDTAVVAATQSDAARQRMLEQKAATSQWDQAAHVRDVPKVVASYLKPETAEMVRKQVKGVRGGVLAACSDFTAGKQTPNVRALFAPFNGSTPKGREEIVAMLTAMPEKANRLWDSALKASTKQHVQESTE